MNSIILCLTGTSKKRSAMWVLLLAALWVGCGGNQAPAPPSNQLPALMTISSGARVSPDYFGMHLQ